MLNHWIEGDGLLSTLDDVDAGSIIFSPLAQGLLIISILAAGTNGTRLGFAR